MKKLIPAICMTLVAAAMFASSTFAWFSMNTTVTATGMQVEAKSENIYLLISSTNSTATAIQTENAITTNLSVNDTQAKLFPAAPAISSDEVSYLATTGKTVNGTDITTAGVAVTNQTTAAAVTNWYTATADSTNASTMKTGSAKQLTTFDGYVIKKTIYLTVAAGSQPAGNLKVTPTFATKTAGSEAYDPATVIVATSDGGFAKLTKTNNGTAVDIKGINTALTSATVLTIDIYIYYDGTHSSVYTNNAANLAGATISLAFNAEYKNA